MAQQWINHALHTLAGRMRAAGREPVGYVNGRAVWPIFGAEDAPDNPVQPPPAPPTEPGFPANTPLEQMSVEQREAYWKDKARKHEDRSKSADAILQQLGIKSADDAAAFKSKVDKHDALELELSSEADKKAHEAKQATAAEKDSFYRPLLVRSKFEALAAGRIEPDRLATILEPLDMSRFLTADGMPDTAKVQAFVDGVAPARGNPPPPPGPSSRGLGHRGTSTPGAGSVAAGRDLYAETHAKK